MQTIKNLQLISTKELRDNLSEILERVAIGRQSFLVAKFGKKKAVISPTNTFSDSKKVNFSKLSAYGIWEKRKDIKNAKSWISNLRTKQSQRI